MDDKKLAEAITKRARDLVDQRIRVFRETTIIAARNLSNTHLDNVTLAACLLALSKQISGDDARGGYPARLWEYAETEVRDSLFGAFDPLQKVLKAKGESGAGGPS